MHKGTVILAAGILIGLAAGCQKRPEQAQYTAMLTEARAALEANEVAKSVRILNKAQRFAETGRIPTGTTAQLLMAEAEQRQGKSIEAINRVKDVLVKSPDDPRANEVMGKIMISNGKFAEAQKYLGTALAGYEDDTDTARANDLMTLASGLAVYAKGDIRAAREQFQAIKDPELSKSVERAIKDATADERISKR